MRAKGELGQEMWPQKQEMSDPTMIFFSGMG